MKKFARERRIPRKIGILGHFGFGNLGDEAVVGIVIKKLKDHYPAAEIQGICLNPRDTERRYGIKAFPIRRLSEMPVLFEQAATIRKLVKPGLVDKLKEALKRNRFARHLVMNIKKHLSPLRQVLEELAFLLRSYRRLRGFDLLVVPGSGQLNDFWGGPWRHPYTLLSWAVLARMAGVEVIVLSIGAGQLRSRLGKRFCKWFLMLSSYRSFRDRYSKEFMEQLGLTGANPVFPDQGFALQEILETPPDHAGADFRSGGNGDSLIVGLNPVSKAYFVPPGADETPYVQYIEKVTQFIAWLLEKGHRVSFCPSDVSQDRMVLEHILSRLGALRPEAGWNGNIAQEPFHTVEELTRRIQEVDLVIASRFHGVVISQLLHKPVIGISYSRKIMDLMSEAGQGEYSINIHKFGLKDLIEKFQSIQANRPRISETLSATVSTYRSKLELQYDNVFTLSGK